MLVIKLKHMKINKTVSITCHSVTIDGIDVMINRDMDSVKRPTIAIFGGSLADMPTSINKTLLRGLCISIGEKLGRKKFNILTAGSTGIPQWIAKSARKNGASVWTLADRGTPRKDSDEYTDVGLYTNLDHEFISYLMGYVADIAIVVGGGIGTLIKSSIMVDYEKPLICIRSTGGIASKIPDLFREAIHNFQDLNLYEVETVNELMKVINRLTEGRIMLESKLQRVWSQIK